MCVFHVNGPNRFEAKSIGIGLKSHVNVVIDTSNHEFYHMLINIEILRMKRQIIMVLNQCYYTNGFDGSV